MTALLVVLGIAVLVALWVISIYNRLVRMRNLKDEAWSGIDVQLKRRFDLIPNLVETVKGYAHHENEVFRQVTEARSAISRSQTVLQRAQSENMLSGALKSLFAVAESYPELKANVNFLHLQEQLATLEDDIQMSRRYYNGTTRDYNTAIETFPAVLVARSLGHTKGEFFEAEETERAAPQVSF